MTDARDLEKRWFIEQGGNMADFRSFFDRDYIASFDLGGRDQVVTIRKVEGATLTGQGGRKTRKPVLHFEGKEKGLALNKTNARTIAAMYSNDTDNWVGKRITLYPAETMFGSERMECIRVRPAPPKAVKNERAEPKRISNDPPSDRQPGDDADEQDQAAGGGA